MVCSALERVALCSRTEPRPDSSRAQPRSLSYRDLVPQLEKAEIAQARYQIRSKVVTRAERGPRHGAQTMSVATWKA